MSAAVRERVSRARGRSAGAGAGSLRFGALEIASIILTIGLIVFAAIYYWTSLKPERDHLKAAQAEYDAQRKSILLSKSAPDTNQPSPAARATLALDSLASFKSDHL